MAKQTLASLSWVGLVPVLWVKVVLARLCTMIVPHPITLCSQLNCAYFSLLIWRVLIWLLAVYILQTSSL